MKAFLHRFNRGLSASKEKDKESIISNKDTAASREKLPISLPPLPEWPPQQQQQSSSQRTASTPSSIASFKPLPDISARPLPPIGEPFPTPDEESVPGVEDSGVGLGISTEPEPSTGRTSRKTTNTSNSTDRDRDLLPKKVAFLSPPPTPSGPSNDRALPSADPVPAASQSNNGSPSATGAPLKTTLSRFQATHGKDPRGSTSTAASSSKTDVGSSSASKATTTSTTASTTAAASSYTAKATSTRTAVSPYPASLRSGTPYSQMSNASSRILAVTSWSEGAEEDLVSNLGPRERTRQEVLWEIVASEERYVADLNRMKETFIEPLLHPYAPPLSPTPYTDFEEYSRFESPQESIEVLPIAARFMSPTGFRSEGASSTVPPSIAPTTKDKDKVSQTPNIDGESLDTDEEDENDDQMGKGFASGAGKAKGLAAKHNHPRSPYRAGKEKNHDPVPFPSRSHQSIPPPGRVNQMTVSSQSLGRQSVVGERERERERNDSAADRKATPTQTSRVLRKFKRSQTQSDALLNGAVPPHQLPEDLRICLEVIESGVLDGHVRLSEGLRKRYDEQYPLVRSLADVFVSNSHLFQGYATYVLHLERALEQVDNALSTASAAKKPKNQDSADWLKVCKSLQRLEESASDKGETGLAITLSKPFQRLLKYPLLFQNLLFHTDPSTFEYESTLQMVAEVETIVRSIEDEKIQKEDRDKTRDVFARIEGLDKVKQLAIPKPSRLLVEERQIMGTGSGHANGSSSKGSTPPPVMATKNVKGKTSFRRLSDVLGSGSGVGGKKDLWLVVFNDVVLRCQRTGTTSLPLVAATNSRTNSLPELQGKSKYATTGRRNSHTRPRNLYKFIKIETWAIGDVVQPKEGVVSMEDVVRSKQEARSASQPKIVPLPDDEEEDGDSDDSDKKSKMSFSYWGADKVTLQKPVLKPKTHTVGPTRRVSPGGTSSYGRESSANAKFGTRLVSGDQVSPSMRPASRRTQGTPSTRTRVGPSDDSHSMKATVTRPAWDAGTRSARGAGNPPVSKRPRQTSQSSAATRATTTSNQPQASPAGSEDSGVGLYRQLTAQDPSLNQ
ncbi:Dbl homology domain-containing protein [Leucogyrophana mollusca]|uniref:Dbl homology domain-containing protein n=1 Tax=Leucogyrophana mollusca TaxID=85980 RepID=A0ACB8BG98_9AGAM|nr:Dbl homology domain-containing protein [Leucogyrophana mollusca]